MGPNNSPFPFDLKKHQKLVLQPSTLSQIQINIKEKLEKEEPTVFEAYRIQGGRIKKKTSRDICVWPANLLTFFFNS